jgi:DNA modification methylase
MEIKTVKISKLRPHPKNPRVHPDSAIEKLERSIKEFGWTNPVLVSADGYILAGHARLKAAEKAGIQEVPVVYLPLEGAKAEAYLIADNRLQDETDWDLPKLKDLLQELDTGEFDIELTGFDMDEIEDLMTQFHVPEEIIEDEVPEPPEEPITKPGDLWILGRHRLLCGDATKKEDVERLMDGKKADMVFTDPPYGIEVVGGTKPFGTVGGTNKVKVNRYSPIIGDDTVSTAKDFYLLAVELGVENFVIWGGNYFTEFLPPRKCWIVWDKKGREWDDNFSDFEMAWTSYEKPAKIFTHVWMGMVQGGKREKRVHPTQKPAELVGKIFNYLLTENDMVILDGFGGSGSTLIACEQLNRTCYMMEIDPVYCDVIIKRWENLTGQKAALVE